MPTFHIGGTGWGVLGFYFGATNIIHAVPIAQKIVDDIETYQITKIFVVPTVLQQIVDLAERQDKNISSVKHVVYGASPISVELLKKSLKIMGCGFIQQYGMTEATGAVTYLPEEDHDVNGNPRMLSCGKAFPGIEFRICDDLGHDLPTGQVGELYIKSPAIMSGYWKMPLETGQAFDGHWYKSGDAGYVDEDGYFYIKDRIKDMIVSGGENIYPAEVERILMLHVDIVEAAVIGVPDQKWGEACKAYIVTNNKMLSEADIKIFCRENIAPYKVPKIIDFVDSLPRNASGKLLKTVLREKAWAHKNRQVG